MEQLWVRACGSCAQKRGGKSKSKGRRTHPLLCFMQLILVVIVEQCPELGFISFSTFVWLMGLLRVAVWDVFLCGSLGYSFF